MHNLLYSVCSWSSFVVCIRVSVFVCFTNFCLCLLCDSTGFVVSVRGPFPMPLVCASRVMCVSCACHVRVVCVSCDICVCVYSGSPCTSLTSCSGNRVGRLCGRCAEGACATTVCVRRVCSASGYMCVCNYESITFDCLTRVLLQCVVCVF